MSRRTSTLEEADEARKNQAVTRAQEIADLRTVMGTVQGRRFVWRLMDLAGVFRSSYTGNSDTFFREGQRNLGLIVMKDVQDHCFDEFVKAMAERKKEGTNA